MLSRIIVGLIGIPILVYVLYYGGMLLFVFVEIISLIGSYEFYRMAKQNGKHPNIIIGLTMTLFIPIIVYLSQIYTLKVGIEFVIAVGMLLLMAIKVLTNKVENSSVDIGETLIGTLYPSLLFSYCIMISFLSNGGKWLLTAQIMVWVCDSFAYFVGLSIGRKIWNRGFSEISPKKSIEGSIGGIIFTIIALLISNHYFHLTTVPPLQLGLLGLAIALTAQIGDLGESMYKREFKIKDSGTILAGHGGILDRFDSMLFVAPVMYYILKLCIL